MNTINVIGNLTRDPEKKVTNNGDAVAVISLADNTSKEHVQYYSVFLYGKACDNVMKYTSKGDRVYVCGKLEISLNTYTDSTGKRRTNVSNTINASSIYFLSEKRDSEE